MTGTELKRWRENRRITQDQLAAMLGGAYTRDKIANLESERTTMANDLESRLGAVEAAISGNTQQDLPAAKPKPAKAPTYTPYGAKCLTMEIQPLKWKDAQALPAGSLFWKAQPGGAPAFNLFQIDARTGKALCTFYVLDHKTWTVKHMGSETGPTLDKLNAWFDQHRAELASIPWQPIDWATA